MGGGEWWVGTHPTLATCLLVRARAPLPLSLLFATYALEGFGRGSLLVEEATGVGVALRPVAVRRLKLRAITHGAVPLAVAGGRVGSHLHPSLRRMTGEGAVLAPVRLPVVAAFRLCNCPMARSMHADVAGVAGDAEPVAALFMDFVVTVRLSGVVNVVRFHRTLRS